MRKFYYLCAPKGCQPLTNYTIMAIAIASVPVLKGAASERFEQQMKESESRRGSVDFTKSIETARKILAKAKFI